MSRRMIALLAVGSLLLGSAVAGAADTPGYGGARRAKDGSDGIVTAQSKFGVETVSGPVRRGPRDRLEVRLPGGTWVECVRSCSDTLRRQTVDFWQNFGGGGRGDTASNNDGPGYLIFRRP